MTVNELLIEFGVDSSEVKPGLQKVENQVKSSVGKITKYLAPLVAILSTRSLFAGFLGADEIGKFANQIGENVQDIDAWQDAVRHAGGSAEAFRGTLQQLQRGLTDVARLGSGRAKAALEQLGIAATDAQGKTRRASDVLLELAQRAETLDKQDFVGLAQRLGIDQGTLRLLQQGNKSVKEQIAILRERAIREDDVKIAAEFNDALQDLRKSFQSVANIVLRTLTPVLTVLSNGLTSIFDYLRNNKIIVFGFLLGLIGLVGVQLVKAIKAVRVALIAFSANPAAVAIFAITAAIAGLIFIIQDLYTWLNGGDSIIGGFFGSFEEFAERVKQAFSDFAEWFKGLWASITDPIINFFKGIVSKIPDIFLPDSVAEWAKSFEDVEIDPALKGDIAASVRGETLAGNSSSSTDIETNIDTINIVTQAQDAAGIGAAIAGATRDGFAQNAAIQAGTSVRI